MSRAADDLPDPPHSSPPPARRLLLKGALAASALAAAGPPHECSKRGCLAPRERPAHTSAGAEAFRG